MVIFHDFVGSDFRAKLRFRLNILFLINFDYERKMEILLRHKCFFGVIYWFRKS